MKKYVFFALFLAIGLSAVSAQSLPEVTIVNNTGYMVWYLHISPTDNNSWEEDKLGDAVLPSGQSFTVRLNQPLSAANRYDIKLIDSDGDSYTKWDVLIAPNARIVFTFDDID